MNMHRFKNGLRKLINQCSLEQYSNTPDWILADYLMSCLIAFDQATINRDNFTHPGDDDAKI